MAVVLVLVFFTDYTTRGTIACDHALYLYLCNLFLGGGRDTILSQITCKKVIIWTSFWLDRKHYRWFALFRSAKMSLSISRCWFQSTFLLAQGAVNVHSSSLWNFCWFSFLEFEECSMFLIEIWSTEIIIFYISSYTKLQSIIHRSFECNLILGTSYRSDKWIHFSNNQFMNGILTWFGCNFPSETCELFWAIAFTTHFITWNMLHQSKHFSSLLSAQNKVNERLPVNSLLFLAFR